MRLSVYLELETKSYFDKNFLYLQSKIKLGRVQEDHDKHAY